MATVEQPGFEIPDIQERDELVLAVDEQAGEQELWTPGGSTDRAAKVLQHVLGVDAEWAKDQFTGQFEAMQLTEVPKDRAPIVSVTVGMKDNNGRVIKPTHVVNGHDQLTTKDGENVPPSYVWPEMYVNRLAAWWNRTRAEGESELIEIPFRIVLADMALRGTTKNWQDEQDELLSIVGSHDSDTTTLEGMTPLDWMMMDADALIGGIDRPDGVTRFVQHPKDRSGARGDYGPAAYVSGSQADLGGWRGVARPGFGFRVVMGQKKQPQ